MRYVSAIRSSARNLQGAGRGKALSAVSAGSFLLIGVQMIYPVLLPEIRRAYGFDFATAGLLLTVLWATNAAGQFPGGVLADRIGEQRTLMVGVGLSAVTVVLIISVGSVIALFAATMLLGAGLALYGVARYTVMYNLYPERAGTTIGIVLAAADAGQAVLPPLASSIALLAVWELGFGFTLPIFGLVFVGMWLYVPSVPAAASSDNSPGLRTVLRAMYTREIGYGTTVFVLYVAVWVAFTSFYPTYLIEVKGLSPTTASILFGSFFAAGVIIKPLSGAIYDKVGVRMTLLALAPVSALALGAVPFVEGVAPLAVITLLVAPLLGSGTIAQSYLIALLADDIQGTGLGIVRTCGLLIGSTTPLLFGLGAQYGYFDESFLALAALVGVMVVLILLLSGE